MAVESEFYHHKFMNKTRQLRDADELHEIIDLLHANYLVQKQLFKELARYVFPSHDRWPSDVRGFETGVAPPVFLFA